MSTPTRVAASRLIDNPGPGDYPRTLLSTATPARGCIVAGAVVLRDLGPSRDFHRYATHWRRDEDGSHHQGGYFDTVEEAADDYDARATRGG